MPSHPAPSASAPPPSPKYSPNDCTGRRFTPRMIACARSAASSSRAAAAVMVHRLVFSGCYTRAPHRARDKNPVGRINILRMRPLNSLFALALVLAAASTQNAPLLPRFTIAIQLETTSDPSANVSMGDLDGDGEMDTVLPKGRNTHSSA